MKAFGDSITVGVGASPASESYISKLSSLLGVTIDNRAVSSGMAFDNSTMLYACASEESLIAFGGNDEKIYGTDASKIEAFKQAVRSSAVWMACPSKLLAAQPGISFSGGWAATPAWPSVGRYSTTVGSFADAVVSGDTVYVGVPRYDGAAGAFRVTIDGIDKGEFDISATGCKSILNNAYSSACLRFSGLGAGNHMVRVAMIGGAYLFLDYIIGSEQATKPDVWLCTAIRGTYSQGGSDVATDAINAAIAEIAAELSADGLSVRLIDQHAVIDPSADLLDGTHPNNAGHAKMADKAYAEMVGEPVYVPAAVVFDGVSFWVTQGEHRRKVLTE